MVAAGVCSPRTASDPRTPRRSGSEPIGNEVGPFLAVGRHAQQVSDEKRRTSIFAVQLTGSVATAVERS
jgi:hypothetical protein